LKNGACRPFAERIPMPSDEAAVPGDGGTGGKVEPLPFDTSVTHQARMYDYVLGGYFRYT
jgi:hypothetical protein